MAEPVCIAPVDAAPTERSPSSQSSTSSELSPVLVVGLLLAALPELAARGLPRPSAKQVIEEIGVSKARAYEMRAKVLETLPSLYRPVGRPPRSPSAPSPSMLAELAGEVRDYLLAHPGAAEAGSLRRRYTDPYRRFVLELCERYNELDLVDFARAVGVPLRTLSDWRRPSPTSDASEPSDPGPAPDSDPAPTPLEPARMQRLQTILSAYEGWKGSFVAFCSHVEEHLRIPYKRTLITRILEENGVRKPRRRPGRSPDERALRKLFQTFFPGAQWSADGKSLTVEVVDERFTFNLELMVDPDSDAFLGLSIRDEEDGQAVVDAFEDAVEETGTRPLALLLDNRPSNHTDQVDEALGDTLRMRSTPNRPQSKAHSEGAFGLFAQTAPPLTVPCLRPYDVARTVVALVVTTWARSVNHRPRADRGGRSRAELYRAADPTPEEVEEARRALEELVRKQELARRTLLARQDPAVRKVLDEAFERFAFDDPESNLRAAIGRYPLDHVVEGVAIFGGKRTAGTLPDGVDARYLLGIVRNLTQEDEGIHIAEALWRARLAARDQILVGLNREREQALAATNDPLELTCRLSDRALASTRTIDRSFWLRALADAITAQPADEQRALFRVAARRIHATHRVPHRERLALVRRLAAMLLPLA